MLVAICFQLHRGYTWSSFPQEKSRDDKAERLWQKDCYACKMRSCAFSRLSPVCISYFSPARWGWDFTFCEEFHEFDVVLSGRRNEIDEELSVGNFQNKFCVKYFEHGDFCKVNQTKTSFCHAKQKHFQIDQCATSHLYEIVFIPQDFLLLLSILWIIYFFEMWYSFSMPSSLSQKIIWLFQL